MMTQRHYWFIANTLKASKAHPDIVEAFVKALEADNPRFKPDLFRKASK